MGALNPEPLKEPLKGSFRKLGYLILGVLIIRILLFRVLLILGSPIFGNSHCNLHSKLCKHEALNPSASYKPLRRLQLRHGGGGLSTWRARTFWASGIPYPKPSALNPKPQLQSSRIPYPTPSTLNRNYKVKELLWGLWVYYCGRP